MSQSTGFEEVMFLAIEERKDKIGRDETTDALLEMLVEIRESALKNDDLKTYDRIEKRLEELGITLREEKRIIATSNIKGN